MKSVDKANKESMVNNMKVNLDVFRVLMKGFYR